MDPDELSAKNSDEISERGAEVMEDDSFDELDAILEEEFVEIETDIFDTQQPADSYWRYYQKIEKHGKKYGKCYSCKKDYELGDKDSRSGLRRHLKSCHPKVFAQLVKAQQEKESKQKQTIHKPLRLRKDEKSEGPKAKRMRQATLFEAPAKKMAFDDPKSKAIDEAILAYICRSCKPLSETESPGFSEMIEAACSRYQVKGHNFMTKLLNTHYEKLYGALKEQVKKADCIALVTDSWSSKNNKKSFLSLIIQYIDTDFRRQFAVATTAPIEGPHDSENFCRIIEQTLDDLDIAVDKVHLLLRDSAAVMRKTARLLLVDSCDCYIHKMQLALNEGIKIFEAELQEATTSDDFICPTSPANENPIDTEINLFLSEPLTQLQFDPLDYWRTNTRYPNIRKIAKRFLTPPPSSVESERVFSTLGGGICTVKRNKLSGEHAKQQLFLHHHM